MKHYQKAGLSRVTGISTKTLTRWQKEGWLVGTKIGTSTWYTMADFERCKKRASAAVLVIKSDTKKAEYKPEKKGRKFIESNDNSQFLKDLYR